MKELGPVVHLVSFPLLGHVMNQNSSEAHECWCEPVNIFWVVNVHGMHIMVVEHNDYLSVHRREQLADQAAGIPESLAWINHALYTPREYPSAPHRDLPFPMREGD